MKYVAYSVKLAGTFAKELTLIAFRTEVVVNVIGEL